MPTLAISCTAARAHPRLASLPAGLCVPRHCCCRSSPARMLTSSRCMLGVLTTRLLCPPPQTAPATSTASPRATTTTAPSGCRPRALSTTATVAAPTRTATTASSKQRTLCRDAPIATVAVISDLCYRLGGRDLCGFPSIHRPQSHTRIRASQVTTCFLLLDKRTHNGNLQQSDFGLCRSR